jgi:hypothetical protein
VVIIEAHPGRPVDVRSVPITAGRPLLDVRGRPADLRARASDLAGSYLRVTLDVDAPAPGLAQQVKDILPDALEITLAYPRQEILSHAPSGSREPIDLLRAYYLREERAELPDAMAALFQQLYEDEVHATS